MMLGLICQELGDLTKNAPTGMIVELKEESNMNLWKVNMEGPTGTPYQVSETDSQTKHQNLRGFGGTT